MFRTVIFSVIFCFLAAASFADIKRPDTLLDTLKIMKAYVEAQDDRFKADIVLEDQSLKVSIDSEDASTFYPDNLHKKLRQEGIGVTHQEILEDHMGSMIASALQEKANDVFSKADLPNIMPVLRHQDYKTLSEGKGATLISGKTLGDMVLLYVLDTPTSVSYITAEKLEISGIQAKDIKNAAIENLETLEPQIRHLGSQVYHLELDGFYEASFILDTKLWAELHKKHGDLYVALPTRDVVMFTPLANEPQKHTINSIKKGLLKSGTYPLSDYSYTWNGKSWKVAK